MPSGGARYTLGPGFSHQAVPKPAAKIKRAARIQAAVLLIK